MIHAKLWKRILNEGVISDGTPRGSIDRCVDAIIKAPCIVDTRDLPPNLTGPFDMQMFKGLAFPFPEFWMEGMKIGAMPFGALIRCGKIEGTERVMVNALCLMNHPQNPIEVVGGISFLCDHGNPSEIEVNVSPAMAARNLEQKVGAILNGCGWAICDTLQLLSCKNVGLRPNENDPKQVKRAIKRHGGTPESYRYHTLVVRPPGAKSDTPGQDIGIMPRHVCRGHFSEYGPEFGKGLLFGKYAGRFYVPPHLKGDKKNGIVEKDYEVRGPQPPIIPPEPPKPDGADGATP